jgi:hypothetical protein
MSAPFRQQRPHFGGAGVELEPVHKALKKISSYCREPCVAALCFDPVAYTAGFAAA